MRKTTFAGFLATFILCYAFWVLLTWNFSGQELIAGAIVSVAAALFGSRFFIHEKAFWLARPAKLGALIAYVFVFMGELIKSNCAMAKLCLFGDCSKVRPGVVRVPVGLKKFYAKAMLANSITLTPGTITLDIATEQNEDGSKGQSYYYIHWINVDSTDEQEAGEMIKGRMEMAQEGLGMIELLIASLFFAALALLCFVRFVKGPTAADRLTAADSMDLLIACALVLYSLYSGRGIYLDVAIITAMLGIIDTVLVGRYLDKGRWIQHDAKIDD